MDSLDLAEAFRHRSCSSLSEWHGTWRGTFLSIPKSRLASVDCSDLYSDVLHRPFVCAHINLAPYYQDVPSTNVIPQLDQLSPEEFGSTWSSKPFILTFPVKEWPVYTSWSTEYLVKHHSSTMFRAEAIDWPLKIYVQYMRGNIDESPLYLFDKSFSDKLSVSKDAYRTPECFGADLFTALGDERPDHAWLIIGPERSGSTFHKDPNATSAWNAVIRGCKYWIMFPPYITPPGVYVSDDQSEVTSPLSIAEWLIGFHAQARCTEGCREGICKQGELLHVPSGWWHLAVNLTESIAITQNFVPQSHLEDVMDFMATKPDQVSGFSNDVKDPFSLFKQKMQETYPDISIQDTKRLQATNTSKKRLWDQVIKTVPEKRSRNVFSFAFGDDNDDDVP